MRKDERVSHMDMSEREYWAYVSEGPEIFVGQATLARVEGFLIGWSATSPSLMNTGVTGSSRKSRKNVS